MIATLSTPATPQKVTESLINKELGINDDSNIITKVIKNKGFYRTKGPIYYFLQSLKDSYKRNGKWVFVDDKPAYFVPKAKKWFTLTPFSREEAKLILSKEDPRILKIIFNKNYSVPVYWDYINVDEETKQEIKNYIEIIKKMVIDNNGNVSSTYLENLQNDNATVIDDEMDEKKSGGKRKTKSRKSRKSKKSSPKRKRRTYKK
jgi:hypothetical protein